ncbi:MAG TPA: O-antigen ligase family protein [Marmoricola sp.]|nr:O-antigen ligase family protein [Marmoricola sp.]
MHRLTFWLAAAAVFTLPWENVATVPGLGSISRAVGLAAAGIWVLSVLGRGSVRRPVAPILVALAFVAWNALSVFWSVDVGVSIGRFITFAQLFVLMYLVWDIVRTNRDFQAILQAYVFGSWTTLAILLHQVFTAGPVGYTDRYTVGSFEFDDLGVVFALGVPLAVYLASTPARTTGGRVMRILNLAHVPAAVVGIMFSGTRTAMLMVVPSICYAVLLLWKLRPASRGLALGGVLGLFVALASLVPQSTIDRILSTSTDRSQGDFNGRTELWAQALVTLKAHPFTGIGTGAFREEDSWKVAHNVWLRFGAELGLIGLGLFLVLMAMLLLGARGAPQPIRPFCYALACSWLIGSLVYNLEDKKLTWVILAVLLIAPTLPDPRSEPGAKPPPRSVGRSPAGRLEEVAPWR